jgi:hypothetical protein
LKKSKIEEIKDFRKSKIWRSRSLKKSKIWSFGDSTRVCNSNWVSGATDEGMPFRYPRIGIPGLAH